jgi:ferrous iron transport protein B
MAVASAGCETCVSRPAPRLVRLGLNPDRWDWLVALAGNPNTGKSTVFNALTGLRQHTGNWPGKTVARAEGVFAHEGKRVKLVDLPGTYSLQAGSTDEEVARDFLLFGRPDVTVVVLDATRLERNLNLALQILEITDRVVVVLNLLDEARRHGIALDPERLSKELGVPVVPAVARRGEGIPELLDAVRRVASGELRTTPYRIARYPAEVEEAVTALVPSIETAFPSIPNARWVALRLLNGDSTVEDAVREGVLGPVTGEAGEEVLRAASALRWRLPPGFHDALMAGIYAAAGEIAGKSQVVGLKKTWTARWTGCSPAAGSDSRSCCSSWRPCSGSPSRAPTSPPRCSGPSWWTPSTRSSRGRGRRWGSPGGSTASSSTGCTSPPPGWWR